jgi:hypothetical protein
VALFPPPISQHADDDFAFSHGLAGVQLLLHVPTAFFVHVQPLSPQEDSFVYDWHISFVPLQEPFALTSCDGLGVGVAFLVGEMARVGRGVAFLVGFGVVLHACLHTVIQV